MATWGIIAALLSGGMGWAQTGGEIGVIGQNHCGECSVPDPNSGFVAVAAGYYHSLGVKADGSMVPWDYNGYGQCNVPAPIADFVVVEGGQATAWA